MFRDISSVNYTDRTIAAQAVAKKADQLLRNGLLAKLTEALSDNEKRKLLTAQSCLDLALHLFSPNDTSYHQALSTRSEIALQLEQYADAKAGYELLVEVVSKAESKNTTSIYLKIAREKLETLVVKQENKPLPADLIKWGFKAEDPKFCWTAENFVRYLADKNFKDAWHQLAGSVRESLSTQDLKVAWTKMIPNSDSHLDINLEDYEAASESDPSDHIGRAYYSIVGDDVSEGISVTVGTGGFNGAMVITSVEFGRP